jgi:hypothetical protein
VERIMIRLWAAGFPRSATPQNTKKINAKSEPKFTERNWGLAGPESTGAFATIAVQRPRTTIRPAQPVMARVFEGESLQKPYIRVILRLISEF